MKYEWLEEYCLSKKGVIKDFKEEWNATRYLVGGKIFAMQGGDKDNKAIITLKCDPICSHSLASNIRILFPAII